MPRDFERCVEGGGRVRTINPNEDSYLRLCWKDGKSYRGEVKKKKREYSKIRAKYQKSSETTSNKD